MLQIQDVRGCSCSVLPQTLGNEGYAVYSAFPQGKKHVNFIEILEFTRGRFQIFKSDFSKAVRLLSFMPLWHVFYATMGISQGRPTLHLANVDLDMEDLKSSKRKRKVSYARTVISYLAVNYLGCNATEIARNLRISGMGVGKCVDRGKKVLDRPEIIKEYLGQVY